MPRIFYGWWIVVAVIVVTAFGGGFGFFSLTLFFSGFEREFGWSRTEISGAISLCYLVTGLLFPVAGRFTDKRSARDVIVFGSITAGLSFVCLAFTRTIWQLYFAYVVLAFGRAGTSNIPLGTLLANWFAKKRGQAMGMYPIGIALGGFVIAPTVGYLMGALGMVPTFWIIAVIFFLFLVPFSIAVIRQKPADLGLLPDGGALSPAASAPSRHESEPARVGVSLQEALRTGSFWLLVVTGVLFYVGQVGVLMHAGPYFGDRGYSTATAAQIVGSTTIVNAVGSLIMGYLADRVIKAKYIMCFGHVLQALSFVFLWFSDQPIMVWAFAFAFGLSSGAVIAMRTVVIAESFGVQAFGVILGVMTGITNVGNILGPIVAGYMFDASGSYLVPLVIFFVLNIFGAGFGLFIRPLGEILVRLETARSPVRVGGA